MNYPTKMLIDHHIAAKTPLRVLGAYVRTFDGKAPHGGGYYGRKARQMRSVITAVFIDRYTKGEYAEDT